MKDNVCIGCGRTSKEIATWSKLSNEDKQQILDRIKGDTKISQDISQH